MSDFRNRLDDETSPYLLQHADNPVAWQPWDETALERARDEQKPIFLSIGYSACHWCHVMERESFEDDEVAEYLNEHFVPIKVDREERPDLDRIYMNATQMLTGQGGWPMSVFLTPEREPFYAGTYFPPEDKWGRPGFRTILEHIVELWENERDRVDEIGAKLTERIREAAEPDDGEVSLDDEPVERAFEKWDHRFDADQGGFGESPKFPPSMQLRALLKFWADPSRDDERRERALEMVETTLVRMASGGMYDQIGGGFHRYSTDEHWLVPHFEKMLYDNALLTLAYVDAYRATGRDFYRRIIDETLAYVDREMTRTFDDGTAAFYSTQDAESEGEEGKFFVWTPESLREVLDDEEAERAEEYWDVSESGNFENGWSIPNRLHAVDDGGREAAFEERPDEIEEIRRKLFDARSERVAPGTDTKVLATWNGLMIRAFARAGFHLDDESYVERAVEAAEGVFDRMVDGDLDGEFELMRTYKEGRARISGYLDDYANMGAATLELFEATGDPVWLERSERLADRTVELFWDDEDGGFFYTADHHDNLIVRDKDLTDNAEPSGNATTTGWLVRLAVLRGRDDLRDCADGTLRSCYSRLRQRPTAMSEMLQSLDLHLRGPAELLVVEEDEASGEALVDVLRREYVPHEVRAVADLETRGSEDWAELTPLLEGRGAGDTGAQGFVCREGTCRRPTDDPEEFAREVEAVRGGSN